MQWYDWASILFLILFFFSILLWVVYIKGYSDGCNDAYNRYMGRDTH